MGNAKVQPGHTQQEIPVFLTCSQARGKTVTRVFDLDENLGVDCEAWVPDGVYLFNFEINYGDSSLLVLDPNDNYLSVSSLWGPVFGTHFGTPTLGIKLPSGILHWVFFEDTTDVRTGRPGLTANVQNVEMDYQTVVLPSAYMNRLEELEQSKRPFSVSFLDRQLIDFIDKEVGYSELRNKFVVNLHFHRVTVQLFDGDYREIGPWQSWK